MVKIKFENSHNRRSSWLGTASIILMMPLFLSSCQPVAAGLAGVGYGIYIALATLTTIGCGIRLKKAKN